MDIGTGGAQGARLILTLFHDVKCFAVSSGVLPPRKVLNLTSRKASKVPSVYVTTNVILLPTSLAIATCSHARLVVWLS